MPSFGQVHVFRDDDMGLLARKKGQYNNIVGALKQAFFFVRLDQNSGPTKTQVFTKTQTFFAAKLRFSKLLKVAQ